MYDELKSPKYFHNIFVNKWKSSYKRYIIKIVNEREDLL